MSKKGKSLLVIDSEQSWLEFCEVTLKENGYEVITAPTSRAAQDSLLAHPENEVVLILIDIKSFEEEKSVIATLSQSESGSQRSVVVVFSTDLTPSRARAAFKQGASDCVSKPYDETGLLALVEQMLADYRLTALKKNPSSVRSGGTVLVVDDDDDWRAALVRYLPPVNQVVTADDYQTALHEIQRHPFDFVIADLRLVDADDTNFQGMDLIRSIRKKDKERGTFTQIIIVSAYGTPEHIRDAYRDFKTYYYFDKRYLAPSKYREAIRDAYSQNIDHR